MRQILARADRDVADWMIRRCPYLELASHFTAIGLLEDGELIAGVLFDEFTHFSIDMHVAAIPGRRWLTREYMGECFRYPFLQLGVQRITGRVPASNAAARRFDEHLGFTLEGRCRRALAGGEDLLIYGMLKDECRWLGVGVNGTANSTGTAWRPRNGSADAHESGSDADEPRAVTAA